MALPAGAVFAAIRLRSIVDVLVQNGTEMPPPSTALPLPVTSLLTMENDDLSPTTITPPPSLAAAVFAPTVLPVIVSVHNTHAMPPPLDPVLLTTRLLFARVRPDSVASPVPAS